MDKPTSESSSSSSSSKLSWLWVIEALASFNEFPLPTLQALIDAAPISRQDFSQNTTEIIALRCLEELSSSSSSTLDSSTVPLDSSLTCQDVLDQILYKVPSSNINTSICRAEFLKWDLNSFIMHKRASKVKCHLEKMKESILDGTLQLPDHLKERSGLFQTNLAHMLCANEGKHDDRSLKGDGNSTYAEGMGAKENPASLLLKDGNESLKKRLPGSKHLCSKRTRVDSADENSGNCLNEKLICMNECNEFLRSTEKQVSRLGKEVSENSIEEIQISKNVGHHSEMNNTETICDGSLEDIRTRSRCTASNLCQSNRQHKVIHGEADIHFNTTLMPQHTSEGEINDTVHVDPIPINDGNTNNNQHITDQSQPQPQQKKPNVASSNVSQKPVASDKDVIDIVSEAELSSDSDIYHNEKIALIAKKDELLRSQQAFGQPQQKEPNVASSNVSQKLVASDKNVVDIVSEVELSSDSDMHHNEKIALTAKRGKFLRSQHTFCQPQQKEPNLASSNVSQKPVASDKVVVDTFSEAELSSDSDMYHDEEIALAAKKDEFMRTQHAFRQDLPAMTESTEQNLCIKCNEVGQLLVCKTSTCSLMMHKICLGDSAQLDANGNFLCPFCEYSHTISEYLEAKKSASLAKKQLAIFRSKGIRN
ncbi:hypothetical protein P8452_05621 [Trifolium repens]|nr:hypothetical protein P8452_05621 [Trifolium repens]